MMSDAYFTLQVYRIYEKHLKDLGIDLDKIMDAKTINPEDLAEGEARRWGQGPLHQRLWEPD